MATVTEKKSPDNKPNSDNPNVDELGCEVVESHTDDSNEANRHNLHDHEVTIAHKIIMGVAVALPFLGLITGIVLAWQFGMMSWFYLGLMIGGWIVSGLGITVGFHRLLTHRSFDTYPWVRAVWGVLGSLAIEGAPTVWCAVHRKHHQFSDLEGDPHSPHLHGEGPVNWVKGFVHSHLGWLFGKTWSDQSLTKFVPDLLAEKWIARISNYYVVLVIASLMIPAAIGGLVMMTWEGAFLGFIWGGLARVFCTHHITWSINSICHVFGSKEFKAGDDSRNNFLFGILGHGEGWHNNHHAFPTSAKHGLRWWQFDLSWLVIRSMQLVGLAWNVRQPSEKAMNNKKLAA